MSLRISISTLYCSCNLLDRHITTFGHYPSLVHVFQVYMMYLRKANCTPQQCFSILLLFTVNDQWRHANAVYTFPKSNIVIVIAKIAVVTSWIDVLRMEVKPRVNKGEANDNRPRDKFSIELRKNNNNCFQNGLHWFVINKLIVNHLRFQFIFVTSINTIGFFTCWFWFGC